MSSETREFSLGETYPAASLKRIFGGEYVVYKNYKNKNRNHKDSFNQLKQRFKLRGEDLNDDQFDAIICAITGLFVKHAPKDGDLAEEIKRKLESKKCIDETDSDIRFTPPEGYALLDSTLDFAKWNPQPVKLVEGKDFLREFGLSD